MKAVIWAAAAIAVSLALLPVLIAVAVTGTVGAARAPDLAGGQGSVALVWALQQLGKPYLWGAAGPDAYDCSGLALRAWEAAGVQLPRVAADQYGAGVHVPVGDAEAGDLVFFAT